MASNKICPNKSEHCTEAISRTEFPPEKSHCPECNHELIPIGRDLPNVGLIDKIKHFLANVIGKFTSLSPAVKYGALGGVALLLVVSLWVSRRPYESSTGIKRCDFQSHSYLSKRVDLLVLDTLFMSVEKDILIIEKGLTKKFSHRDSLFLEKQLHSAFSKIEKIKRIRFLLIEDMKKTKRLETMEDKLNELKEKIREGKDRIGAGTEGLVTPEPPKPDPPKPPNNELPSIYFLSIDGELLNPRGSGDNIFKHHELRYIFLDTDKNFNAILQPDDKRYNPVEFTQGIGGAIHILKNDRLAIGNYTLTIKNKKGKIIHQRKFTIVN